MGNLGFSIVYIVDPLLDILCTGDRIAEFPLIPNGIDIYSWDAVRLEYKLELPEDLRLANLVFLKVFQGYMLIYSKLEVLELESYLVYLVFGIFGIFGIFDSSES